MNICVFCSMYDVEEKYKKAGEEFGHLIAQNGHTLIWGGSNSGLMKVIADATQEDGGSIIGITIER
jgi:predicted Rossmann-fold nucleotide-binding protein